MHTNTPNIKKNAWKSESFTDSNPQKAWSCHEKDIQTGSGIVNKVLPHIPTLSEDDP
jgi:hypothetical protein